MSRYREQRYASYEEFNTREAPKFDTLSDAIDGLMDAVFLDEIARQKKHEAEDDDLFESAAELDFAF